MLKKLIYKLGWCPYCQKFHLPWTIKKRRLNTMYADDEQNYMTSCVHAYKEVYEYYEERWNDYYSGLF